MFACAHPAIDPAIRAPLMLQTVLGLDAAQDRCRLPHVALDHGPAAGPREAQDPPGRHPLRVPDASRCRLGWMPIATAITCRSFMDQAHDHDLAIEEGVRRSAARRQASAYVPLASRTPRRGTLILP